MLVNYENYEQQPVQKNNYLLLIINHTIILYSASLVLSGKEQFKVIIYVVAFFMKGQPPHTKYS